MTAIGHNGRPPLDEDFRPSAAQLEAELRYCRRICRYVAWDPEQWREWSERVEIAEANAVTGR
jgi:hypothetical protein